MTTSAQARGALRSRMEGGAIAYGGGAVALRWQNEDGAPLPDSPAPFVYTEFHASKGGLVGTGGGRGNNIYRVPSRIECFIFVPRGWGLEPAETIAEQIAVLFRSYRDDFVSCFDATVRPGGDGADLVPPGLSSDAGQYFWATCEVSLHFDQTG